MRVWLPAQAVTNGRKGWASSAGWPPLQLVSTARRRLRVPRLISAVPEWMRRYRVVSAMSRLASGPISSG
ncbi:hypothetical protein D9M69_489480 [compost metagenome]